MILDAVPASSNRAIFLAAVELVDEQQRRAFLDEACGQDARRRREIERLLAARGSGQPSPLDRAVAQLGPAETKALGADGSLGFDVSSHPMIGPYQLLEQIGEGGMGAVFMAQQCEPIKRTVALKLIKPGMDSREVISRFQSERQALAMMDHPNIARVLDAGTTAQGPPYFVMELVRGILITDYCDENRLSIGDRLRLFLDVCRAVQHAHQKGIIHRDLKPSNVMITLHDGTPVVKVIDFGVAKALHQELSERTLLTQFSQMIGTPLYMSPEQADLGCLDVDTRSDVYSLGVLLYELLTGATPFDREALFQAGLDAMRRMIREDEPPRPSARLSSFPSGRLSTISASRRLQPAMFRRVLRGELDWIVMRALEKDRNRRYESASALAADVERYLDDEPVLACPPSAVYRLRKLTRRHKGILSAAALSIFIMLIGLVVSSKLTIRASNAEHSARTAQTEAERTAEEMRNLLYASDVMLASRAWRQDDVQQARERLARHIPEQGQRDVRGFEWHYLWKQQDVRGVEIANLGSAVYDIALSPDGNLLAATGADAIIHLFQTSGGEPRLTIPTHQVETNGVDFSPDSRRIAATGDDGTLRVWDLDTRRELWTAAVHEGLAYQVRYSPDGKTLATCGVDDRVRLWDAATGASLGTLNEHEAGLETIAMSSAGVVAAGDRHSRVTLWDLEQAKPIWTPDDIVFDPVSSVIFSGHGYLAHGTVGGLLTVVEARTRAVASQRRFADGIQSLAFAPLGSWLAVGGRSGNLRIVPFEHGVWDLRTSREWPAHEGRLYALEVAPDGKRIFSGGADGRLMAWNPFGGAPDRVVRFKHRYGDLQDVDGERFVISGVDRVILCDRDGAVLRSIRPPGVWQIDVAASARRVFGRSAHEVAAWDIDTGTQVFHRPPWNDALYIDLAVTPDGRTVCLTVVLPDGDRKLQIFDVVSGSLVAQLPVRSANTLDISPDGRWLAFDAENDIQLYDLEQRRMAGRWSGHRAAIRQLRFSHDGRRLGSISADRTLKLWSMPGGELAYSVIAHRIDTVSLAISPDGRRIATAGKDRMLRLWNGQSAEPLWEYPATRGQIVQIDFSADGQRLLCLCGEHDVLILDGSPAARAAD